MKLFYKSFILSLIMLMLVHISIYANGDDPVPISMTISTIDSTTITFQWDKVDMTGAVGYNIFTLKESGSYTKISDYDLNLTTTSYTYSYDSKKRNFCFYLAVLGGDGTIGKSDIIMLNLDDSSCSASPSDNQVKIGDTIRYSINFSTLDNAISAAFGLSYNPDVLKPVKTDGEVIEQGDLFDDPLTITDLDEVKGIINFAATQKETLTPQTGDKLLGFIDFVVLNGGDPDVKLNLANYVSITDDDNSNLTQYYSITSQEVFSILDFIDVDIIATLEYRTSLKGLVINITNSDTNEVHSPIQVTNEEPIKTQLFPGMYTFEVTAPGYLVLIKQSIEITEDTAQVDLGTLIAGDSNNDNVIDNLDLNVLKQEYTKQLSSYDSDFNDDGFVDLLDLTILGINYNKAGDN